VIVKGAEGKGRRVQENGGEDRGEGGGRRSLGHEFAIGQWRA